MRRDLPDPRDARVLHGHVEVQALGHRLVDEGGPLLGQQVQQLLLLLDEGVDGRRLAVQEGGDGLLGGEGGKGETMSPKRLASQVADGALVAPFFKEPPERCRHQAIE